MKKLHIVNGSLLILLVLSIFISYLTPFSIEQVEEFGMGENVGVTVKHGNITQAVSDNQTLSEYVNKITINNTQLVQQNADLEKNLQDARNDDKFYAAIGIAASIGSFILGYFLTRRTFKSDTMLALFNIINGENVKLDKKTLADEWNKLKNPDKDGNPTTPDVKATFENFKNETMNVMEAYNQVGALYELNLIDKKHFRKVYGGNLVRTYNLSKDHIEWWRENGNKDYCIYLENVATELMKNTFFHNGINEQVYKDKSSG